MNLTRTFGTSKTLLAAARFNNRAAAQSRLLNKPTGRSGLFPQPRRMFSSKAQEPSTSIFDSAEFYEKENELESFSEFQEPTMPFMDANDTFASIASCLPKDIGNVPHGVSTYGLWEYLVYLDDLFFTAWMTAA